MKKIFLLFLIISLISSKLLAADFCVTTEGEAIITNGDLPSARMEAIARAKWRAIEQVVGTSIKARTLVENFTLVDEVVQTQVSGVVKKYDLLAEERNKDSLLVKISACVEPLKAREAVTTLALNNSVALFIPARKPVNSGQDEYEETNILSETLLMRIIEQGYRAVDVAPTRAVDAREIEDAVKTASTLTIRSLVYKFLSNIIIIGHVTYNISSKKGEDVGYGISMPFNYITCRLQYRIVTRNPETDHMEILATGVEEAKAMAPSLPDAVSKGLLTLAEKVTPLILDKLAHLTKKRIRNIRLKVLNVPDGETTMEIKRLLQSVVWVSEVEETGIGEYIVKYPENPLYLANSLRQKGGFILTSFSPYSLTFTYANQ